MVALFCLSVEGLHKGLKNDNLLDTWARILDTLSNGGLFESFAGTESILQSLIDFLLI
jgi:hypothetical protein